MEHARSPGSESGRLRSEAAIGIDCVSVVTFYGAIFFRDWREFDRWNKTLFIFRGTLKRRSKKSLAAIAGANAVQQKKSCTSSGTQSCSSRPALFAKAGRRVYGLREETVRGRRRRDENHGDYFQVVDRGKTGEDRAPACSDHRVNILPFPVVLGPVHAHREGPRPAANNPSCATSSPRAVRCRRTSAPQSDAFASTKIAIAWRPLQILFQSQVPHAASTSSS